MTGKGVLENGSVGALILIAPAALLIIVLFKAWPAIIAVFVLTLAFKIWQQYQWQQWSSQVNPDFNRLVQDNRGCITPMDLSLKTSMSGKAAQRFLDRKAEEFGAQKKDIPDRGTVYYFLTANALGSIFDDSEPLEDEEEEDRPTASTATQTKLPATSLMKIAQLLEDSQTQTTSQSYQPASEPALSIKDIAQLHKDAQPESAISTPTTSDTSPPDFTSESTTEDETQSSPDEQPIESVAELSDTEEQSPPPLEEEEPSTESTADSPVVLNQTELAKRLDLHPTTISKHKLEPDFDVWSQSKDPEGIAWKYNEETKEFMPTVL